MPTDDTIAGVTRSKGRGLRRFVVPAIGASACAIIAALGHGLEPLHRSGADQGLLGLLIAVGSVVEAPVRLLFGRAAAAGYLVFIPLVFVFYFCIGYASGATNRRLNRSIARDRRAPDNGAAAAGAPPAPQSGLTRRRLLLGTKRAVVAGTAAAGAYPVLVEPHRLEVTRRSFPLRGLPPELEGLRVVQLADIHHGPWSSVARVRRIVDVTNGLAPDLVLLNGDYVLRDAAYAPQVAAELAWLKARVGVVGVLGNHDWWLDGPLCRRELEDAGVRMIDNGRVFVTPDRTLADDAGEGLCVAGVGDLWTDQQLYDRALAGVPEGMPRLLLSHNPDVAEERAFVSSGYRVDLMLSGHTHGGQVRLPVVGSPVTMSRYGQKYVRGLVRGPACPVYISRGLGMAVLPVRVGSVPEIAVIELVRGA